MALPRPRCLPLLVSSLGTGFELAAMHEKEDINRSQLFTIRVWLEAVGDEQTELRGTLKHILSGETHHFRDWPTLVRHLEAAFAPGQVYPEPGE